MITRRGLLRTLGAAVLAVPMQLRLSHAATLALLPLVATVRVIESTLEIEQRVQYWTRTETTHYLREPVIDFDDFCRENQIPDHELVNIDIDIFGRLERLRSHERTIRTLTAHEGASIGFAPTDPTTWVHGDPERPIYIEPGDRLEVTRLG